MCFKLRYAALLDVFTLCKRDQILSISTNFRSFPEVSAFNLDSFLLRAMQVCILEITVSF